MEIWSTALDMTLLSVYGVTEVLVTKVFFDGLTTRAESWVRIPPPAFYKYSF